MKLTLTKDQRAKLFAGGCPRITGDGTCPVEPGYVYTISRGFTLQVTRVVKRDGGWHLRYTVRDTRHKYRNVRRTPADNIDYDAVREAYCPENFRYDSAPIVRESGNHDSAEESAYTSSQINLVAECGEGVDAVTQERFVAEGRLRHLERQVKRLAPGKPDDIGAEIASIINEARSKGVDVTGELRVIRKRMDAMRGKIVGRAA